MSKIKCLACGRILESKHVHDFVVCGCPKNTFLDGGDEYFRALGDADNIEIIKAPGMKKGLLSGQLLGRQKTKEKVK